MEKNNSSRAHHETLRAHPPSPRIPASAGTGLGGENTDAPPLIPQIPAFAGMTHTKSAFSFSLDATDGKARAGTMTTPHGIVHTPIFMPVGTRAAIKGATVDQIINI